MRKLLLSGIMAFGRVLAALLGGLRVSGRENVPKTGPVLLVPNHVSDIDPPLVGITLPRRARYMAKSELFEMRVLGPFIRFMGAFPVRRYSADRTALRAAEEYLKNGEAVVLFPEGKLSEDGALQPFLPGAALIGLRADVPVVPVGIVGSPGMLPYGRLFPKRSPRPVQVKFGPPIPMDDLKALPRSEAIEEATRRMEAAVAELTGQPVPTHEPEEPPAPKAESESLSKVG